MFFFQNPAYTVFDREFHGLSKSLFGFDLANGLRGEKTKNTVSKLFAATLGDNDRMDWSDENYDKLALWCFETMITIDCDEHICAHRMWSCGDGQCILWQNRLVLQNFMESISICSNGRNMNYMCELHSKIRAWTLSNGLCWGSEVASMILN